MHNRGETRDPRTRAGATGRLDSWLRQIGIDPRRCHCLRCVAIRTGIFRRHHVRYGTTVYLEIRVCGVRTRRQVAYDMDTVDTGGGTARA